MKRQSQRCYSSNAIRPADYRELDRLSEIVKNEKRLARNQSEYRSQFQLSQTFNRFAQFKSFKEAKRWTFEIQEFPKGRCWLEVIAVGSLAFAEKVKRASPAEAGRKLDGGLLPLLMSIARIGSTETRRWR